MTELVGKTILHYKIVEQVGQGGMGIVYKAEDTKLERTVSIKFLPHHISASFKDRERFKNEAKAAAALNHPNIAHIYAIEETDDDIFIVMEYIDGVELKNKINSGTIPTDEAIGISIQIAKGLEAAHNKGIVHRDIKSSNIMITDDGKVKIMDFGLAKIKGGTNVTKIGTTVGTAAYMSPEQAKGDEVDHLSDIWSFGVVLYEMLTGQMPFKGEYDQAIIYSNLNEEPNSLMNIHNDIPARFENLVNKLLMKKREKRFQEINDVINELKNISEYWISDSLKNSVKDSRSSIAVLPFTNMSADLEQEFFCDGISEEIINSLAI
jgi:non-specific serine/threonine protein kinase